MKVLILTSTGNYIWVDRDTIVHRNRGDTVTKNYHYYNESTHETKIESEIYIPARYR